MNKKQFRVLYREFLFRIIDLDLLSQHAEGDSRTLLGQFASLLIFFSLGLGVAALIWASTAKDGRLPPLYALMGAWTMEHFLVATTMLAVGVFAVLSWESTFPDRRDVLVLGPLPVPARTFFLAKVAAVATALGLTLVALHSLAGLAWPIALAQSDSTPAPSLVFDPPLPPAHAADLPAMMNRDIAPMLRRLDLAAADGGAGIVVGVSEQGVRRIMAYGAAKPDSLFEIGSITKTFTGLLLAQMAVRKDLDLRDPVRDLLPISVPRPTAGYDVTLLDLATHHSGLPRMPDNGGPGTQRETYTNYQTSDLYDFIKRHGLAKPSDTRYLYSNVGFAILGAALMNRAGASYPELLARGITGPLGMRDTAITLPPDLQARLIQGYDHDRHPTPPWDLSGAYASAGGIRSTAADMLTYLEAQLHPERSPFPAALAASQRVRAEVAGEIGVALAWEFDPATGAYSHGGATGGYTSVSFFNPRRDAAGVILVNSASVAFPFFAVLGEHVQQRLEGVPALSLTPVVVSPAGPLRSFFAYWITMIAAGVFIFCGVLGLQGLAAQILPRRWFLRVSAFLQMAFFCLFVTAYCLQRSPVTVLVSGPRKPWLACIPSYWFVGLYQQLSGSLHPALASFAQRAWIGLLVALCATGAAYAASYQRTLRRIVEEPDIAPAVKHAWLPRFGGAFETAIAHFSIRSLLRSRQHRVILAFYVGVGSAIALLFLNAPADISGEAATADKWRQPSVPLLASTIVMMAFWVVGTRVVISLPLDLRANWVFRVMPFAAGPQCLRARRRAVFAIAVLPAWLICAALIAPLWPFRPALAHLAILALFGTLLAEFSFDGAQKIPFTCSYLPGRSNIHILFPLWIYILAAGLLSCALGELHALRSAVATLAVLACLAAAALLAVLRNNWLARPSQAELRFEEIPPDQLLSLELSSR